jgi:PleD family two-component response regulator
MRPQDTQSGALVRRADLAMFEAKKSGRNRVKVAADESP